MFGMTPGLDRHRTGRSSSSSAFEVASRLANFPRALMDCAQRLAEPKEGAPQFDRAVSLVEKAVSLSREHQVLEAGGDKMGVSVEGWYLLGHLRLKKNEESLAMKAFRCAVQSHKTIVKRRLRDCPTKDDDVPSDDMPEGTPAQGQTDDILRRRDDVLASGAYFQLGAKLLKEGSDDDDVMVHYFEKSIELRSPKPHPSAVSNLALVHLLAGRFDTAATGFRDLLRLEPDNASAQCNLGRCLAGLKEYDRAKKCLDQSASRCGCAAGLVALGQILKKADDSPGALKRFSEALRSDPECVVALRERARILLAWGHTVKAADDLRRAQMVVPSDVEVTEMLRLAVRRIEGTSPLIIPFPPFGLRYPETVPSPPIPIAAFDLEIETGTPPPPPPPPRAAAAAADDHDHDLEQVVGDGDKFEEDLGFAERCEFVFRSDRVRVVPGDSDKKCTFVVSTGNDRIPFGKHLLLASDHYDAILSSQSQSQSTFRIKYDLVIDPVLLHRVLRGDRSVSFPVLLLGDYFTFFKELGLRKYAYLICKSILEKEIDLQQLHPSFVKCFERYETKDEDDPKLRTGFCRAVFRKYKAVPSMFKSHRNIYKYLRHCFLESLLGPDLEMSGESQPLEKLYRLQKPLPSSFAAVWYDVASGPMYADRQHATLELLPGIGRVKRTQLVHRELIAIRSEYFRSVMGQERAKDTLVVKELSADGLDAFVTYVYTDAVSPSISLDLILHLLAFRGTPMTPRLEEKLLQLIKSHSVTKERLVEWCHSGAETLQWYAEKLISKRQLKEENPRLQEEKMDMQRQLTKQNEQLQGLLDDRVAENRVLQDRLVTLEGSLADAIGLPSIGDVQVLSDEDIRVIRSYVPYGPFDDSLQEIGRGSFGNVYRWEWKRGSVVALRVLSSQPDYADQLKSRKATLRALRRAVHPNLSRLLSYSMGRPICFVTELYDKTIAELIAAKRLSDWNLKMRIVRETAMGLSYLHSCRILHRELKWENVMLSHPVSDPKCRAVVIDYGFVSGKTIRLSEGGTTGFMAPELFKKGAVFSFPSDVYAFGIMIYELVAETKTPYGPDFPAAGHFGSSIAAAGLIDKGLRPDGSKLRKQLPEDRHWIVQMMESCWSANPLERFTFHQIVRWMCHDEEEVRRKGHEDT